MLVVSVSKYLLRNWHLWVSNVVSLTWLHCWACACQHSIASAQSRFSSNQSCSLHMLQPQASQCSPSYVTYGTWNPLALFPSLDSWIHSLLDLEVKAMGAFIGLAGFIRCHRVDEAAKGSWRGWGSSHHWACRQWTLIFSDTHTYRTSHVQGSSGPKGNWRSSPGYLADAAGGGGPYGPAHCKAPGWQTAAAQAAAVMQELS